MHAPSFFRACAILLLIPTAALTSQEAGPASRPATSPRDLCFRGAVAERCRSFLLTELSRHGRVAGTGFQQQFGNGTSTYRPDLDTYTHFEFGVMHNRPGRTALGFAAGLGQDGNGLRFTAKARRRRWIGSATSLDLGAGFANATARAPYPKSSARAYGLTGEVAVNASDLVGLHVSVDVLRTEDKRTASALYVGARLGSYAGLTTFAVVQLYRALLAGALMAAGG